MSLPLSAVSFFSAFSTRSLISLSEAATTVSCRRATTWSRFRTSRTPSTFRAASSARAFSSGEFTVPWSVTTPSTVSTLMSLELTPRSVRSAIFVLAVIQGSEGFANAGPTCRLIARTATAPNVVTRRILFLLWVVRLLAPAHGDAGGVRPVSRPIARKMTASTTNTHPNSADSPATPRKPSSAATSAITKNISAQWSIAALPFRRRTRAQTLNASFARTRPGTEILERGGIRPVRGRYSDSPSGTAHPGVAEVSSPARCRPLDCGWRPSRQDPDGEEDDREDDADPSDLRRETRDVPEPEGGG